MLGRRKTRESAWSLVEDGALPQSMAGRCYQVRRWANSKAGSGAGASGSKTGTDGRARSRPVVKWSLSAHASPHLAVGKAHSFPS